MLVRIGPVSAAAARSWCAHLRGNLEVVARRRDVLPFRLPDEIVEAFGVLLDEWVESAFGETFEWEADLREDDVRTLVRYWANLDALTSDHLARFEITWSPAEARPFFDALVDGIAAAFAREGLDDPFVELLRRASQPA